MDVFKRALDTIRRTWGTLGTSQKVLLSASAVAMVLLLVWGSTAATAQAWTKVAGSDLRVEERDAVQKRLQEKNVRHEVRNLEIYVPREHADAVILELAGEGVISDQAVWKFLESESIFVSKWQLEKRFQVALQRRLELMVRRVDAVRNAAVQISPGSEARELGFAHGSKASASVVVELHPGKSLTRPNVVAIAGLVARAVPGLDSDRVHLMDTRGNVHRVPRMDGPVASGEIRDIEARLEAEIEEKILRVFPTSRTFVRVIAKASEVRTREKKFGKQVPRVEESRDRVIKSEPAGGPGGIKGESSAVPERAAGGRQDEKESESRTDNHVDVKETEQIDPMGVVESITVGVLIPKEPDDPITPEQAKDMIQKAVGKQAEANGVSVVLVPTKKPEAIPPVPLPEKALAWLSANWTTPLLALFALVAIVVMARIVRGAMARSGLEEIQALQAALAEGVGGVEAPAAEGEVGRVKQGLRDMIGRNPAHAAAALKQMMAGK